MLIQPHRFFSSTEHGQIHDTLCKNGLVFINGLNDTTMVELSEFFGTLLVQDDTNAQGIKFVEPMAAMQGSALHTDRSNMHTPPWLVLIACLSQSTRGGTSTFCDGKQLASRLMRLYPDAWSALSTANSACFGRPGYQSNAAIFNVVEQAQCYLKFRTDPWGFYNAAVWAYFPLLLEEIERCTQHIVLEAGQGYLVHNGRWLHGALPGQGGQRTIARTMIVPTLNSVSPYFELSRAKQ